MTILYAIRQKVHDYIADTGRIPNVVALGPQEAQQFEAAIAWFRGITGARTAAHVDDPTYEGLRVLKCLRPGVEVGELR